MEINRTKPQECEENEEVIERKIFQYPREDTIMFKNIEIWSERPKIWVGFFSGLLYIILFIEWPKYCFQSDGNTDNKYFSTKHHLLN